MVKKIKPIAAALSICLLLFAGLLLTNCNKKESGTVVYTGDCAHRIAGIYSGSDYCSSFGQPTYQSTISASDATNITFSNLGGATVTAVVDSIANTISIPTQTFPGNFSIAGTGTFTNNRIIINWSGLAYGAPITCSTTFTR
jgi:hypothetical protein